MNTFETQPNNFELEPNTKVTVVAFLDDIGGKRYFLKTDGGQYIFLQQDLEKYEEVSEVEVASAILKHGYKPQVGGEVFEFGKRREVLKVKI